MTSNDRVNLIPEQLWLSFNNEKTVVTLNFHLEKTRNAISSGIAESLSEFGNAITGKSSHHPVLDCLDGKTPAVLALRSHCEGVFLSGGNLYELASMTPPEGERFTNQMRIFTEMLRTAPFVTVALLNGIAAGGGAEIALATDLRFSLSDKVQIQFAQTHWGVPAGWGMMTDLSRKGIFTNERRRGIAMASQESLGLEDLINRQLIDGRFENASSPDDACNRWLESFVERLSRCPDPLKRALIVDRPNLQADKLEEFDKNLFGQYWLESVHKDRIQDYLQTRSEKKKDK
ncbi:MAG: enoyl-CoA hydratase/isomerase family protein [Silvanigrellaceae bacterium]